MNRKDIELFGKIQNRLQGYCGKVLATLVKDYPEVDICEFAKVIGIDILAEYLQMTYYAYPINRSIYIPLQYVEGEPSVIGTWTGVIGLREIYRFR